MASEIIENADKMQDLHRRIVEEIKRSPNSEAYEWYTGDAEDRPETLTTDRFVYEYIYGEPPDSINKHLPSDQLDKCSYINHLRQASELLDVCSSRMDEIYRLEASSITSALDFLLAEKLAPSDFILAKLGLRATRSQIGNVTPPLESGIGDEQMQLRYDASENDRTVRQVLHGHDGSPFNYAQRIKRLRTYLADDVRSIIERLTTARIGANMTGAAPNLPKIEAWNPNRSDNLQKMIFWTRDAIRNIELNMLNFVFVDVSIFLKRDGLITTLSDNGVLRPNKLLQFELTRDHTDRLVKRGVDPIWMVNAGLSFSCSIGGNQNTSDERSIHDRLDSRTSRWKYTASITPPKQTSIFAAMLTQPNESYQWSRPAIEQFRSVSRWGSSLPFNYPAGSSRSASYASPFGKWTGYFEFQYFDELGNFGLHDPDVSGFRSENSLVIFEDIILNMTLAHKK
jgi:hypothetical protein